jgi:hypothetical protein
MSETMREATADEVAAIERLTREIIAFATDRAETESIFVNALLNALAYAMDAAEQLPPMVKINFERPLTETTH